MGLHSLHLEAFGAVAKFRSFSKAAKELHVTQSALSQRIINLESDLKVTLFIRDPGGLRLTDEGHDLLRYCVSKDALEEEFLGRIRNNGLHGGIRIGGFSSITRSILLPLVTSFSSDFRSSRIELLTREIQDLFDLLTRGQVDFILTTVPCDKNEVVSKLLGHEVNVLVQGKLNKANESVYLDHDSNDTTTTDFLKLQTRKIEKVNRHFLDEVYAIIDAVALGLGQAVLPQHLIVDDKRLKVVGGLKPLKVPVYLQYYKQPFYSKLQSALIENLSKDISKALEV